MDQISLAVGHLCLYVAAWLALGRTEGRRWPILILAIGALVAFRSIGFPFHSYILPDEAQALIEAKMFMAGGVPWLTVDTTTCGPLNAWVLSLPSLFGIEPTYFTAQLTALALQLSMLLIPLALLPVLERRAVWASFFIFWAWACFIHNPYLYHFLNVDVPWAMLNLSFWLAMLYFARRKHELYLCFGLFVAGAIPFAKIQFGPYALAFALFALTALYVQKASKRVMGRAVLAGALFPLGMISYTVAKGAWHAFWESYILRALSYGRAVYYFSPDYIRVAGIPDHKPSLIENIFSTPYSGLYFGGSLFIVGAAAALMLLRQKRPKPLSARLLLISTAFLAVGVFAIYASKTGANYYLLLLMSPLVVWTAAGVDTFQERRSTVALTALVILALNAAFIRDEFFGGAVPLRVELSSRLQPYFPPLVDAIKDRTHPGDRIGLWGYAPEVYLFTETLPATREAIEPTLVIPNPQIEYYRARFLSDLRASQPELFIDATGDGAWTFNDRKACGFENDPALAAYIAENYRLEKDLTRDPAKPGPRVYRRITERTRRTGS